MKDLSVPFVSLDPPYPQWVYSVLSHPIRGKWESTFDLDIMGIMVRKNLIPHHIVVTIAVVEDGTEQSDLYGWPLHHVRFARLLKSCLIRSCLEFAFGSPGHWTFLPRTKVWPSDEVEIILWGQLRFTHASRIGYDSFGVLLFPMAHVPSCLEVKTFNLVNCTLNLLTIRWNGKNP